MSSERPTRGMEKTVLAPELGEIGSAELDATVSSVGVVTEREGYQNVSLSGLVPPEGDLETQTRSVLAYRPRSSATTSAGRWPT